MHPLSDLTQAPLLYVAGDKTYEVKPLTQSDMGSLLRYIQFRDYYTVAGLPDIPADKVNLVFDECRKKTIRLNDTTFSEAIQEQDALREVAYLSIRHSEPKITREDVGQMSLYDLNQVAMLAVALTMPDVNEDQKKTILDLVADLKTRQKIKS